VVTYLIETGTTLDQFVVIGELPAGTQPGSYSVTVSFDLTVPGGLMAGSFEVTASTSVHLQSD
jgi:hypothetical protein